MAEVKYYLIAGRSNVARDVDGELTRLDKETGEWVSGTPALFDMITFEASTKEVTEAKAKDWVEENHPDLTVEWL